MAQPVVTAITDSAADLGPQVAAIGAVGVGLSPCRPSCGRRAWLSSQKVFKYG